MEDNIEVLEEEVVVPETEEISQDVIEPVEVPEDTKEEFTKLLEDYLREQLNNEEVIEDDEKEDDTVVEGSDLEVDTVDYSVDLLSQILDLEIDTNDEIRAQNIMLEDLQNDNMLASQVNDVSLTNFLLIVLFITILFNAVLNFSRRIF